jgi:ssDNA-binding Zn-finger/Zn-ribbon topoisomerase 1
MLNLMSDDFAVRCTDCQFTWNTPAMAEGLRVLGACPKCKGALEFGALGAVASQAAAPAAALAPHLVLGIPRL